MLPTAGDDVTIDTAVDVTVSASASVRSLQVAQSLTLTGTLTIAEASAIGRLTIAGGTQTGAGDLTVEGVFDWSDGHLFGTGKTIVAAGAQLNIVGDAPTRSLQRTLENAGTALYSGTGLVFRSPGAVLNNLAGATFIVDGEGDFLRGEIGGHAFHNAGTFIKRGEGTTTVFSDVAFHNSGTIDVQQGNLQLGGGGSISGTASIAGGTVQLTGGTTTLQAGASLSGNGVLNVAGGTLDVPAEASLTNLVVVSGGTQTGAGDLTVEGVFDWSDGHLFGTGKTIVAAGAQLNIVGDAPNRSLQRTLENAGTALYSGTGLLFRSPGAVLRNLAGGTFIVDGEGDFSRFEIVSHSFDNAGTFIKRGEGTTTVFSGVAFDNNGTIDIQQGNLQLAGGGGVFRIDGTQWLSLNNGTSINVPAGLIGETTNADLFSVLGTVTLQGGTVAAPSPLEVMGQDLGPVAAGFRHNFTYDRLQLESARVRLQDAANNAAGATAEALYVNTLIVPAGSTLDLNGFAVYARTTQIAGSVINGNVTVVPEGGGLLLGVPVSGSISVPHQIDEWTFHGRSGRAVAILAEPMTTLQRVQVQLLDPDGAILAAQSSDSDGASLLLSGVELPRDGIYRVRVMAAESVAANTGSYRLAVFDATVDVNPLVYHQRHIGALESNFSVDRWTFSAAAGQALRLDRINADSHSLRFRLSGPDGWVGFDGVNSDSEVVVTPAAGEYLLEAYSNGHASGHYAFQMLNLSAADLTIGVAFAGELAGTGDAQLFKVELEYMEDTSGNRTSVTYSQSEFPRPTEIVHSSGASIQIAFNGQGRIGSVTDSTGWTTTYSYDASGEHLLAATDPSGTTTYDYFTSTDAAREHALRSITDPSGVTQYLEYDSRGRVSATYFDTGAARLDFDYSNSGMLTTTDATGREQQQYFNHFGQILRTEDAAGAYVNYAYNDAGQVIQETDSLGRSRSYAWCGCGSLVSFTDENGNSTTFSPGGSFNRPTSFTDARGNKTSYTYDADGNLTSTIYPDGSVDRATFDGAGNPTSSTNRQEQTTQFSFNNFGQITQEIQPDGSSIDYVYDSRQRLSEITDTQGTTRFESDAGDRLTRVEYPNGRWLEYEYDAAGRRTLLADHTGFTVRYPGPAHTNSQSRKGLAPGRFRSSRRSGGASRR